MSHRSCSLIAFLHKIAHKIGRLRKFNCSHEIEFNFLTAWTFSVIPNKKTLRQRFVDKFKSRKTKKKSKRIGWEIPALGAKAAEVFSAKLMKRKQRLPQRSSISERRRASTAMAFSLHNHCPCRVLCRVHTRLTTAPRIDASCSSTASLFALETSCPVLHFVEAQVHSTSK